LEVVNNHDSFTIYICVEGEANIKANKHVETIKKGETILLPAAISAYEISTENATLLEVYV
jgi:mannose-6-phosphate isomerase